jgi:outer membrane receptor protein involved in Fe transport
MSVITARMIETAPTQNFAELLRSVPGLNITQVSACDINVTSRAPTGTLATGQLALLDGRSLYQDFFGFVMWDFLPVNLNEIKQVEVIRGPAPAVWGANALYGVVNVITKSPREMPGTSVTFGLGMFDRSTGTVDADNGNLVYFSGTHAQIINDRWSFKVSGGGYSQDALPRPTGTIPGSGGTQYPPYVNTGTTQPKLDGRVDYDFSDGSKVSFSGGFAGTEGIMHSGIGPFDIDSGSTMGYGRLHYSRKGLRGAFFTNILDGTATNLLTRDTLGVPIGFDSKRRHSTSSSPTSKPSPPGTSSATVETSATTASSSRSLRAQTIARNLASTRRTRSSCPIISGGSSVPASTDSITWTISCSRRGRRSW